MTTASTLAGLGAAAGWGAGDFWAGFAGRRASVLLVALVSQLIGLVVLPLVALALGEPLPARSDLLFAAGAGASAAVGIGGLYAALAAGRMGVAAPITGVLAAAGPVTLTWATVGPPATLPLTGMVLGLAGIALVSGPRAHRPPNRVLVLSVLAGAGFAGFLFLLGHAGGAFVWTLVAARVGTCTALALALLAVRPPTTGLWSPALAWVTVFILVGDVSFLAASRLGRLDVAAVTASLYPLVTVSLARWKLGERLSRVQSAGAGLMLVAIPLIASG